MSDFEPVIGLEVHVQLKTASKMFCSCANQFGAPPNSLVCPICMGHPGVLPVVNKQALYLGLRTALALGCAIGQQIVFVRKSYFYPDLPKNYQISQYSLALAVNGCLALGQCTIGIKRVHLEEDAGKLIHASNYSLVDLNRAGVPLLEIVTDPDIPSAEDAYQFLKELKMILRYIDVSDCDMEKGFLRCDANISLRRRGTTQLGVKTELKNMNSFKQVKEGLSYEIKRQTALLEKGKSIAQQTLLWDTAAGKTCVMRTKEEAHDYRYFAEPDLVSISFSPDEQAVQQQMIKELPAVRRIRFVKAYGLSAFEIEALIQEPRLSDLFEQTVKQYPHPAQVAQWITGLLVSVLRAKSLALSQITMRPQNFAKLIQLMDKKMVTNLVAKDLLAQIIDTDQDPEQIVREQNLGQVSTEQELSQIVEQIISEQPQAVKDLQAGKEQAVMFLVGQVMRKTKGRANPQIVKDIFKQKLQC